MPKIERLPSGNYRIRVTDSITGKRKSITAPTRAEVQRMAAEYLYFENRRTGDVAISDAINEYIENRKAVLSPSTYREYKNTANRYYDSIAAFTVGSIQSEDVQRFVNALSVRNIYGLLNSAITALAPDKYIRVTLPQKKPVVRHIPTDDDIKALLSLSSGDLKKAILLASVGTLRRGEVCALEYSDIKDNSIHVHADMVISEHGFVVKEIPKNSSSDRYIIFPEKVIDELGTGEGRVVPWSPSWLYDNFAKVRDELHLECRFHDLRHYAASIMHALGVPDQYIMERGGWSSDVTLKSVYRNVLEDKKNEFTDRTNDYMSRLV